MDAIAAVSNGSMSPDQAIAISRLAKEHIDSQRVLVGALKLIPAESQERLLKEQVFAPEPLAAIPTSCSSENKVIPIEPPGQANEYNQSDVDSIIEYLNENGATKPAIIADDLSLDVDTIGRYSKLPLFVPTGGGIDLSRTGRNRAEVLADLLQED